MLNIYTIFEAASILCLHKSFFIKNITRASLKNIFIQKSLVIFLIVHVNFNVITANLRSGLIKCKKMASNPVPVGTKKA